MSSSRPKNPPKNIPFKLNQHIVYPIQGVGKIIDIKELPFGDATLWYYIIELNEIDMVIKIPVDKAEELGVRLLVSKKEADKLDDIFSKPIPELSSDWKQRYQQSLDLLKKGSIANIAEVVYSLHTRKKIKELPILERKLYDNALQLLIDELALTYGIDEKAAAKELFAKMDAYVAEEADEATEGDVVVEVNDDDG